MKPVVLLPVLAGVVIAGDIADEIPKLMAQYPSCALECLIDGAMQHGCSAIDYQCQCTKAIEITKTVSPCFVHAGCRLNEIGSKTTRSISILFSSFCVPAPRSSSSIVHRPWRCRILDADSVFSQSWLIPFPPSANLWLATQPAVTRRRLSITPRLQWATRAFLALHPGTWELYGSVQLLWLPSLRSSYDSITPSSRGGKNSTMLCTTDTGTNLKINNSQHLEQEEDNIKGGK
jgi:hypothetical protein